MMHFTFALKKDFIEIWIKIFLSKFVDFSVGNESFRSAVLNPRPVTNPNAVHHAECYSLMC